MYGEVSRRDGGDKKLENGAGRVAPTAFFANRNRADNPSVSCADSSLYTREPGCGWRAAVVFTQGSQGVDGGQQQFLHKGTRGRQHMPRIRGRFPVNFLRILVGIFKEKQTGSFTATNSDIAEGNRKSVF